MKSVAIVGLGPSLLDYLKEITLHKGRLADEIWTINWGGLYFHNIDLIFAMDDFRYVNSYFGPERNELLKKRGVKVITSTKYPEYPFCEEFPLKEAEALINDPSFIFDNSCTYAIAHAWLKGFDSIYLYGFEFFTRDKRVWGVELKENEPDWHRFYRNEFVAIPKEPGMFGTARIVEKAQADGVSFHIPTTSTFLDADIHPFHYGYKD